MTDRERDYDRWLAGLTIDEVRQRFRSRGCTQLLVKPLAGRQDNDKNQIYVGADLSQVAKIPSGEVVESETTSRKPGAARKSKFTASVDLIWISPAGDSPAPEAKLIYYPQYPEVRLSGLISRSSNPPRSLYSRNLRGQEHGRHLLLGLKPNSSSVWGMILPPESTAVKGTINQVPEQYGVFQLWQLESGTDLVGREALLHRLRDIHSLGWVPGQRLKAGEIIPYAAQNAGGYTLEALLDVSPNGRAEPDFEGWEVKALRSLGPVTLMTPEPTGGIYRRNTRDFLRQYGYRNAAGDRYDFTGRHFIGDVARPKTGTRIEITGWDGDRILEPGSALRLLGQDGEVAASWRLADLMSHWKRKHAQCCYVRYETRDGLSGREYRFGPSALLCENTTFLRFLQGFKDRLVYYDPGINMKQAAGINVKQGAPRDDQFKVKKRSQFRVAFKDIPKLYGHVAWVDLSTT